MSVEFVKKRDEFGTFFAGRVHSPYGGMIDVNPFEPTEMYISHQYKGRKHGFGVKITSGKQSRVLQVRSLGEAAQFMNTVQAHLNKRWFWDQAE
jgi:hypothetical protein